MGCNRLACIVLLLMLFLSFGCAFADEGEIGIVPLGVNIPGQIKTAQPPATTAQMPGSTQQTNPSGQAGQSQQGNQNVQNNPNLQNNQNQQSNPNLQTNQVPTAASLGLPANIRLPDGFPRAAQVQNPQGGTTQYPSTTNAPVQGPPASAATGAPGAMTSTSTEGLSEIEKFISGKSTQDITFDIKQFGYDLFPSPATPGSTPSSTTTQSSNATQTYPAQSSSVAPSYPAAQPSNVSPSYPSTQTPATTPSNQTGQSSRLAPSYPGVQSPAGTSSYSSGQTYGTTQSYQATQTTQPSDISQSYSTSLQSNAAPSYTTTQPSYSTLGQTLPERQASAQSQNQVSPFNFVPQQNVPVGPDYVIGPGDEVRVNVWGGIEGVFSAVVDRDGNISVPKVGTFAVAGLSFAELKEVVRKEISKSFSNFELNVSMGQLRTMTVYIIGNANRPGAYSISALSTLINALFVSGGPSKTGSMRDIQLVRGGRTITHLDLYDFLIRGQKEGDVRLMPEDTIFISPIGPIAGIAGSVTRPAIYELKGPTRVSQLIKMAGGLSANAYRHRIQVESISETQNKTLLDVDISQLKGASDIVLHSGDIVKIFPVTNYVKNQIILWGNVVRPGQYEWKQGMRVTDLIKSRKDLLPDTLMDFARIDRQVPPDLHQEYVNFSLGSLLLHGDQSQNLELKPGDIVVVYNKWDMQDKDKVRSEGALNRPGEFDFRPNMKLSDLLRLSGGLKRYAAGETAELTRVTPTPQGPKTEKLLVFPLRALEGDPDANIILAEDDYLFVRTVPEFSIYKFVAVLGEVKFPGKYTIERGERLSSVLTRAGGLTRMAYPRGSTFLRESIRQAQQAQMNDNINRLEIELMAGGASNIQASANAGEAQAEVLATKQKETFLQTLRSIQAKGRMVIRMDSPEHLRNMPDDIEMEDGDILYIPPLEENVKVVGAVFNQTSFRYIPGKDLTFYIKQCGGYTRNADKKSVYVLKVDGRALKPDGRLSWMSDSNRWEYGYAGLEPGDAIIVPDKLERISWMKSIKDVTTILANIATSAGIAFVGLLK